MNRHRKPDERKSDKDPLRSTTAVAVDALNGVIYSVACDAAFPLPSTEDMRNDLPEIDLPSIFM